MNDYSEKELGPLFSKKQDPMHEYKTVTISLIQNLGIVFNQKIFFSEIGNI